MVGQEILVLFIMVRIRAPQPRINNAPQGHFLFVARRADCNRTFHTITAKRYQRFVRVSENHRFPKTLVGASPHPCVRPN